ALEVDLQSLITNGMTNVTFVWSAADNPDVAGETLVEATSDTITDALVNTTGVDQTVIYTVIPTGENGCVGDTFMITVTVKSEPVGSDPEPTTCSDDPLSVALQSLITNGMTNVTFVWSAADNPDVTGETLSEATADTITDQLTNLSMMDQVVVYTVTPTSEDGCVGEAFTVTVTVLPEPVGSDPMPMTCSDEPLSVDLQSLITNGQADVSFSWVAADNPNVSGETLTTSMDTAITDTLTNVSGVDQIVIYTVTPIGANDCAGNEFTVTVTVKPEPVITATLSATEICSRDSLDVDFMETTGLEAVSTVSWEIVSTLPAGVDATSNSGTGDIEDLVFTNISSDPVQVDFEASAVTEDGCLGDTITFSVIVEPEPNAPDGDFTICTGAEFSINLQDYIDEFGNGVAADFTFEYVAVGVAGGFILNNAGLEFSTPSMPIINTSADGQIDVTFTNLSAVDLDVQFIVTPTAEDGLGCVGIPFVITVTIEEPVNASIITGGTTDLCTGDVLTLEGIASQGTPPYSYNWTIIAADPSLEGLTIEGHPDTASGKNVDLTAIGGSGIVTVELIITDDNGCASEARTVDIEIFDSPAPQPIIGDAMVCPGDFAAYFITPVAGNTYSWSLSSGGELSGTTGPGITVAWTSLFPGTTHLLTVTETTPQGCFTIDSLEVTVQGTVADFNFAVDTSDMSGLTIDFMDASTPALGYAWDFGGEGTSSDQNPSFTFPASGTYEVCLTIIDECGSDQVCKPVTVDATMEEVCDTIILVPGINLISLDVTPDDASADAIFGQLGTNLVNAQGRDGTAPTIYAPNFPFNSLDTLRDGCGYFLRMNVADTLIVCGTPIDENFFKPLIAGINLVGYIPQDPQPITDYFDDAINGNIPGLGTLVNAIAYDPNFVIFSPNFPFNSLTEVKNGRGYEVRMNAATGPLTETASTKTSNQQPTNSYDFVAARTNLPASTVGDWVDLIDREDNVVAQFQVADGGYLLPQAIFGPDTQVDIEGLEPGTSLYFRYQNDVIPSGFDFVSDKELHFVDLYFNLRDLNYTADVLPGEHVIETLLTVGPNPFTTSVTIDVKVSEELEGLSLKIMNVAGQEVARLLSDQRLGAGKHSFRWEAGELGKGTYYVVLEQVELGQISTARIIKQ
ncbi:MAG: PKD-like domain-containing protein, partial [Bacteroidota bacterium]